MQYAILSALSSSDLQALVNQRLERGWEPIGSIVIEKGVFYQTLIYRQK